MMYFCTLCQKDNAKKLKELIYIVVLVYVDVCKKKTVFGIL